MVWLIFTYLKDPDLLWCRYKSMNYQHLTVVFLALRYSVDNVTVSNYPPPIVYFSTLQLNDCVITVFVMQNY